MKRALVLPAMLVAAVFSGLALASCGSAGRPETISKTSSISTTATTTALPGANKPTVTIGDKNFTEQFVLGELYRQALAAQGYTALINRNIGPTEVTTQALQSGRLSMYPEYLGTWVATVAGDQQSLPSARTAYRTGQDYARAHGLELLHPTPFSDVNGVGVTAAYAQQYGLATIGDLTKLAATLTLGAPPQFKVGAMGLPGLERVYGVFPATFKPVDVGEQYQALDQGSAQAVYVMSTDPELLTGRYQLLSDPRRVFGWGNVVPVVPQKVLTAEGPQFAATIDAVSALLSTQTMRTLNAAVDVNHQDPVAVAKQFLVAHGLVPASS